MYDVSGEYFDKRWNMSGFSSLVKVERRRGCVKNGKVSEEIAYFISNGKAGTGEEYFKAISRHWSVEMDNHVRDVTLREDQLRTKKSQSPKS